MGNLSQKIQDVLFYAILDTGYVERKNMYAKCEQLICGNAGIIQLRAKKESHFEMREIAFEILPLFQKKDSPIFVINDNIDLALSIENAGLHIGQDDMCPKEARKLLGNNRLLGLSTHSIEQATCANNLADTLDYFAVGPVFATNTKPGRAAVGLELVSQIKTMKPALPWFAIGGVNFETAPSVVKAGAERLVVVSALLNLPDSSEKINYFTSLIKHEHFGK